jgi:hypothetical protein
MNQTPEQLALQHSLALCQGHADALQDALQDIKARGMGVDEYANLGKEDRRLLDQFAYRYTRIIPLSVLNACKLLFMQQPNSLHY